MTKTQSKQNGPICKCGEEAPLLTRPHLANSHSQPDPHSFEKDCTFVCNTCLIQSGWYPTVALARSAFEEMNKWRNLPDTKDACVLQENECGYRFGALVCKDCEYNSSNKKCKCETIIPSTYVAEPSEKGTVLFCAYCKIVWVWDSVGHGWRTATYNPKHHGKMPAILDKRKG